MNNKKTSPYILLLSIVLLAISHSSCSKKSSTKNNTVNTNSTGTISSGSSSSSTTTTVDLSSELQSCGRTTGNTEVDNFCFHTVSPTVKVSGLASSASSFQTSLHATIPQSKFETDLKMYVRIIPKPVDTTELTNGSLLQRRCSASTVDSDHNKYRYSKMRVTIEVKPKNSAFTGDIKTIDGVLKPGGLIPSSKVRFNTSGPGEYDIIVRDVKTNHRCSTYGTGNLECSTYEDIPYVIYNSYNYPTNCVGFEIQFSTDYTRDLP